LVRMTRNTFFSPGVLQYFTQTTGTTPLGVFSDAFPRPQDVGTSSNSTRRSCHLDGHP
jgi:hypothetical protein